MGGVARSLRRGIVQSRDKALCGLQSFSATNYLQTATNGGEVGVSTGFGSATLFRLNAVTAATAYMLQNLHSGGGWAVLSSGGFLMKTGVGAAQVISSRTFVQSDIGKVFLLIGRHSGASNLNQLYVDRALNSSVAQASYVPASGDITWLGNGVGAAAPADNVTVLATCTFRGTPSDAQIQAYYDGARVLGELPDTMPGATVTHLWSAKRELVGLANVNARKTYGARLFSIANYYQSAVGAGIQGSTSGFWAAVALRFDAISTTNQFIASCYVANNGWYLQYTSSASIRFVCQSAGTNTVSTSIGIATADIGQPLVVIVHYTGTAVRLYYKRAQVGADVVGNFTPSGGTTNLSASTVTWAFTDGTVFALEGGLGNPTLAEVQGVYDTYGATGVLAPIAGKTDHRWSLEDQSAIPTTLLDRIGTDNLTNAGLAVRTDSNSIRSIGPYLATTDFYQTALGGGIQGGSAFWVQVDVWLNTITASAQQPVACAPSSSLTGWALQFSGAGQAFGVLGGGSSTLTSLYTFTGADLNKRLRFVLNKTAAGVWQLWVNGVQVGADVTGAAFTANAANAIAMTIGQGSGSRNFTNGYVEMVQGGSGASLTTGEIAALNADLTTAAPSVAGKTQKRHVFETDIAAVGGTLPAAIVERITGGDSLARYGGLEAAIDTATAPAAPLQLTDRITAASGDAFARVGAPTVKVIDTAFDGRRTLGAQGANAASYFVTAAGAGLKGSASGSWVALYGRIDALSSATGVALAENLSTSATQGWALDAATNYATVYYSCVSAAAAVISSSTYAPSSADVGIPILFVGVNTGSALRLYVMRQGGTLVQVGADVAISGYTAPVSTAMSLLNRPWQPTLAIASNFSVFGFEGGDGVVPTLAELQQLGSDLASTGRLQPIAGKTTRLWDLTTDTIASGVDAVPIQVVDRLATTCLVQTDANSIRGVGPYASGDYWKTVGGGGIQGQNAGFHVVVDIWLTKVPTASEYVVSAGTGSAGTGWLVFIDAAGNLQMIVGGVATSAARALLSGDLNKRLRVVVNKTASVIQLFVNGTQAGSDVACASFTANASTLAMVVGCKYDGTASFGSGYVECVVGGNVALSAGNVTTYNASLTAAPPTIVGVTLKRYVFEQDISANGGVRPAASVEQIAGGDDLTRYSNDLARVGIDVHMDANAIRGVGPYGAADWWQTAPGGGIQGASGGFHGGFDLWLKTISPAVNQTPLSCTNATASAGYYVSINSSGMRFVVPGVAATGYYVLSGSDLNKRLRVVFSRSAAGVMHMEVNGVAVTDATAATYSAAGGIMSVGRYNGTTESLGDGYIENVFGGNVPLTAGNFTTYNADLTQAPPTIAGVTLKRYVFEQDIAAVSGALPARSVERISGGDDMVRIGSPLTLAQRTERLWSYETPPLFIAGDNFTASNYLSSTGGPAGSAATGVHFAVLFRVLAQATSATRVIFEKVQPGPAFGGGYNLYTTGVNSVLAAAFYNAAGTAFSTTSFVLGAAEIGKLHLAICTLDLATGNTRMYLKRVSTGAGNALNAYATPTGPCTIGSRAGGAFPATDIQILGMSGGEVSITSTEAAALYDDVMAYERIRGVPGKATWLVDLTRDALGNGGAIPATCQDRIGSANATMTGTLTATSVYARAWGW